MSKLGFLFSKKFLEHETGNHPENKERLNSILKAVENESLDSKMIRVDPVSATTDQIALVHDPGYISTVRKACENGYGRLDADTAISHQSYSAALLAAGSVITAVDMALEGKLKRAFCAVRPPGHHAERDRAMGFCLFNNIAIGAEHAIKACGLNKVFIIDWDVHHGNGTQNCFYNRGDVYYTSIHQWPHYPGTGSKDDRGEGEGNGANMNFPLPANQGDEEYISIFNDVIVPEISGFSPDLIMISAGFDAHQSDFLAGMNVTTRGFGELTGIVVKAAEEVCEGRIISVLEGGYHLNALGESVAAHLNRMR